MQRNDNVIPRLSRGAGDGVTKMCAMQVVSWQTGDAKITDYPSCSARPLARIVQCVNDTLAGPDGFLSPEDSVLVLDLGWLTVGTAGVPVSMIWQWLADVFADEQHGMARHAPTDRLKAAYSAIGALCTRCAAGERPAEYEWTEAKNEAKAAAWAAGAAWAAWAAEAAGAAWAAGAAEAAWAAWAAWAAEAAGAAGAAGAAEAAGAAWAAGAAGAAWAAWAAEAAGAAGAAEAAGAAGAAGAAEAAWAYKKGLIDFTRWAIQHWRNLADIDQHTDIDPAAVDNALARIGG